MQDAVERGRIAKGFKLPQTKLSDEQVAAIVADPRLYKDIAPDYGIHKDYVSILKRANGVGRYKCGS